MTNIMAYIKNKGPDKKGTFPLFKNLDLPANDTKIAVGMSDGLGSGNGEVINGYQKTFHVAGCYILGTGSMLKINFVAEQLANSNQIPIYSKKLPPKELGQKIIETIDKFAPLKSDEGLNFIVFGENKDKELEACHLIIDQIKKPLLHKQGLIADGSGSAFVMKAIERDQSRGLLAAKNEYETIADIALDLYDKAYVATKSAGVNDEFQFSFILPEGNATLFHPRIHLKFPTKEYLNEENNFDVAKAEFNKNIYAKLYDLLEQGWRIQNLSNMNYSFMTSSIPFHQDAIFSNLEDCSTKLKNIKKEINLLIFDYVSLHNKK